VREVEGWCLSSDTCAIASSGSLKIREYSSLALLALAWSRTKYTNLLSRNTSLLGAGALIASLAACKSPPPGASVAQCDELLDRYTELALRENVPDASIELVAAQKKQVREMAAASSVLGACPGHVSEKQRACAMAASTPDGFEACLVE
jgi:hypothetical protein